MNNDHRSPSTPDDRHPRDDARLDSIDLLASRRVDGEISASQVPDDVRAEVEARVLEFSTLRARLRATSSSASANNALREAQIARALRSTTRSRSASRLVPSTLGLGIAASIICVAGIAAVVLRQADSADEVILADSAALESGVTKSSTNAGEQVPVSDASSQTSSSDMMAIAQSTPVVPEYTSVQDIVRRASSIPGDESPGAEQDRRAAPPLCGDGVSIPLRVELALLDDRSVEIHFFAREEFVVYAVEDCSVVARTPNP